MKSTYSNITHNNFIWIRYLLIATVIILFADFCLETSQFFFDAFKGVRVQNFIMLLLVACIIYTAYFGLHQSKVLVPYFLLEHDTITTVKKQFLDNGSIAEFKRLEQNLQKTFIEEKPYLDTELTLSKLAEITTISDRKLSMLLNQHMNISFYDFVNDYRITAFKEAIKSNMYNKYTIESIAFKCGFKSKASFYRIFKIKTNMSPSEFKKRLN